MHLVENWAPSGVLQASFVGPPAGRHVIKLAIKRKVKKATKGPVVSIPNPIGYSDCHKRLGGLEEDPKEDIYVCDRGHRGHGGL